MVTAKMILGALQFIWFRNEVVGSGLFDPAYYVGHGLPFGFRRAPLLHYFLFGATQGRRPHPLFDTDFYLNANQDVAKSHINPLLHYLRWGAYEGRDPQMDFNSSYYLSENPDVRASGCNPLIHYLFVGVAEGRNPNPDFDTVGYLERNPEVALAALNPLIEYVLRKGPSRHNPISRY